MEEAAKQEAALAARLPAIAAADLRPAADADIPRIVALMNRAYRGTGGTKSWSAEEEYIRGDRTTEALLRADLGSKEHASLLIWREPERGELTACVWLEPLGNAVWYLGSLAVEPQQQNSGLGRDILSAAEEWILERGGIRVRISVVHVREALIAWYLRRGYRKTGETEPFPYGDDRFGVPQRDDLSFVILEKELGLRPVQP